MKKIKNILLDKNKEIYIPILGIVVGELMLFYGMMYYVLWIYILNLLIIILMTIFLYLDIKVKNVLQSLSLLIILRMINLSMPPLFTNTLYQYLLLYGIMFLPIYSTVKNQQISFIELGIDFRKLYIYIPIALIIGTIVAIIEFKILNPIPLIDKITFSNIIIISIVMIIFIGLIEELIFRSILQTRIEKVLGSRHSILLCGIVFGIVHASYGNISEILFASIFGIILGYIFYKTRNLPFIVSIHGSANIILYGILPKWI